MLAVLCDDLAADRGLLLGFCARYGGMADFTRTPDTFTASVLLYTGGEAFGRNMPQ